MRQNLKIQIVQALFSFIIVQIKNNTTLYVPIQKTTGSPQRRRR
jgi:hypothetical protein